MRVVRGSMVRVVRGSMVWVVRGSMVQRAVLCMCMVWYVVIMGGGVGGRVVISAWRWVGRVTRVIMSVRVVGEGWGWRGGVRVGGWDEGWIHVVKFCIPYFPFKFGQLHLQYGFKIILCHAVIAQRV